MERDTPERGMWRKGGGGNIQKAARGHDRQLVGSSAALATVLAFQVSKPRPASVVAGYLCQVETSGGEGDA